MQSPQIRAAIEPDHATVLSVLTEAFMDDPVASWLFPDPGDRRRLQARIYRHELARPGAEVYLVGARDGASIWQTSPAVDGPDAHSFGESATRLYALGRMLAPRHPAVPHLYLFCMGVSGDRQGAGLASAMLRHRLKQADADGLGAYLEASTPRSRALYQRHGFVDLGEPVRLPDGPTLWPMWRGSFLSTTKDGNSP